MPPLKIGTRESVLAVWQAKQVQMLFRQNLVESELVFINSEGDLDLITPLYEMGVQGIFTKTLDAALLNRRIDIAVHSMKDVPTHLPAGIRQAAVLQRGSYKDLLVFKGNASLGDTDEKFHNSYSFLKNGIAGVLKHQVIIGTSSIRRKAQWLHRYPHHTIENLRGNVNTRLRKLHDSKWTAAIFAAAGLERINLRPPDAVDLDWMLPAPAQGAIMVVCRSNDDATFNRCQVFNHQPTEICTKIEKDFLRTLMGGCSTPVSALAQISGDNIVFKGSICSVDGRQKIDIEKEVALGRSEGTGAVAAEELLLQPNVQAIVHEIQHAKR